MLSVFQESIHLLVSMSRLANTVTRKCSARLQLEENVRISGQKVEEAGSLAVLWGIEMWGNANLCAVPLEGNNLDLTADAMQIRVASLSRATSPSMAISWAGYTREYGR